MPVIGSMGNIFGNNLSRDHNMKMLMANPHPNEVLNLMQITSTKSLALKETLRKGNLAKINILVSRKLGDDRIETLHGCQKGQINLRLIGWMIVTKSVMIPLILRYVSILTIGVLLKLENRDYWIRLFKTPQMRNNMIYL